MFVMDVPGKPSMADMDSLGGQNLRGTLHAMTVPPVHELASLQFKTMEKPGKKFHFCLKYILNHCDPRKDMIFHSSGLLVTMFITSCAMIIYSHLQGHFCKTKPLPSQRPVERTWRSKDLSEVIFNMRSCTMRKGTLMTGIILYASRADQSHACQYY